MRILLSWLGGTDLNCADGTDEGLGPLARGVTHDDFDKVVILNNYSAKEAEHYVPWLKKKTGAKIELKTVSDLPSPVDYRGIYLNVIQVIDEIKDKHGDDGTDWFYEGCPQSVITRCGDARFKVQKSGSKPREDHTYLNFIDYHLKSLKSIGFQ